MDRTLKQASKYLLDTHGKVVTPSTLQNQALKGVLVASKLGRDWSVTESALDDYARDHAGRRKKGAK